MCFMVYFMKQQLRVVYRAVDGRLTPAGRIIDVARMTKDSGMGRGQMRHYPHRAAVLLVRGGGFYRDTEGVTRVMAPGDLIFVEPRVGHAYGPEAGGTWEEIYVVYEGPVFDALAAAGAPGRGRPVLRLGDVRPWQARLKAAFPAKGAAEAAAQIGALVAFILAAHAAAPPETGTETFTEPEWLARARQLLAAPGAEAPGLAAVARACGLGLESFRKQFTARTGEAPGRYRLLAQVEMAKRLLRDRDVPLRVVAESVGFCDEFHFSKTFKRVTGLSPRTWRDRL